jgi:hypothetical protein
MQSNFRLPAGHGLPCPANFEHNPSPRIYWSTINALKPPTGNPDNEMKRSHTTVCIITLFLLIASAGMVSAAITTFDYTQTDSLTGSGTIAPPGQSTVGGVTITWSPTVMPQASVRDPSGSGSAGGAVGGFNAQEGNNGGNGRDVAIYWNASTLSISGASTAEPVSVEILGSGSDGNSYSVRVPLVFFGDNVLPDEHFPGWGNNDFHWNLEYGDILGTNPEGSPRTSMWLSPTFALTVGGRAQRYTQNTNALTGVLINTDTSSGAEKDAFDQNGNTVATAAIGQPLEFGFGWRDRGSVTGGPVLVDNFNVQGLLEFDEANIALVNPGGLDGDELPDSWELTYFPDLNQTEDDDAEPDGLTNGQEFNLGTNPTLVDTDGDEISDGDEFNKHGTDPAIADSDGDRLDDGEEINGDPATNPLVADSDGDGLSDGDEVLTHDTNPTNKDSDNDGYNDGVEVASGSDPNDDESTPPFPTLDALLINEFMADNSTTLIDSDGDSPDWIELWNPGSLPVNLAGYYLTDNPDTPNKWALPSITLQANQFLVIFASGKDRIGPGSELHTDFQLDKSTGSHLALTRENGDGTFLTLSAFALYPKQVEDVSYGAYGNDSPLSVGFFTNPTPGAANDSSAVDGFVADTSFTVDRGLYSNPFTTTITTPTPGATLIYTLDGTAPSASNGTRVTAANDTTPPSADIEVTTTTTLRTMAIKAGFQSTNIDTQTFIFPADVLQQSNNSVPAHANWGHNGPDFAMDPEIVNHSDPEVRPTTVDFLRVPSVSLVMDWNVMFGNGGIYISGEGVDRPTSIEYINPEGDTNDPNSKRGFQVDGTVRIVGGSSTSRWKSDKLSMRLKFSPDLRYELFGKERTDRFDTLILDHRLNNVWHYNRNSSQPDRAQYTHDQFPADLHNLMAGLSPEGRYCLLYINGILWGITELHERPDDNFAAEYLGGDNGDYDAMKHRTSTVIAGSNTNYNAMLALSRQNMTEQDNYQAVAGVLHIENFISYMIANYYVGNSDWAHQNWYATYNRVSENGKWYYHSWDPEHCMESTSYDATSKDNSGGPTEVFHNLIANPEFKLLFADRVHQHFHNDGVLTPQNAAAAYMRRADAVDPLTRIESARWGDNARSNPYTRLDWLRTRDQMLGTASGGSHGNFFPNRTGIVFNQFRSRNWYPDTDAPNFSQHGGNVPADFNLSIASPDGGTVYYTLDGSDPRTAAQAATVTEHVLITENATKRAIMPTDSSLDATWFNKDFDDSSWPSGTLGAGYDNASTYDPLIDQVFDFSGQVSSATIETVFMRIGFDVADPGLYDAMTLKVRYDDGFVAYLNGTEIARNNAGGSPGTPLAYNAGASASHSDNDAVLFLPFPVSQHLDLLQDGSNTLAIHGLNTSAGSSDMLIHAILDASEGIGGSAGGLSPAAKTYSSPVSLPNPETTISARVFSGTQWSPLTRATFLIDTEPAGTGNLVISKIHYRPSAPSEAELAAGHNNRNDFEYIELMNIGAKAVDLSGTVFSSGIDFDFNKGSSIVLASGARTLLVENPSAFAFRFGNDLPVLGKFENGTNLANGGERLTLLAADLATIRNFEYDNTSPWPSAPDGGGSALTLADPLSNPDHSLASNWQASATPGGNPGSDDGIRFESWQADSFTAGELADPAISAAGSNPDGDTLTNLEEFLFGGNPKVHDGGATLLNASIQTLNLGNGVRDFAFLEVRLNRAAGDSVDWRLLTSTDGETWIDAAPLLTLFDNSELGEGRELRRYRVTAGVPDTATGTHLFRIESSLQD